MTRKKHDVNGDDADRFIRGVAPYLNEPRGEETGYLPWLHPKLGRWRIFDLRRDEDHWVVLPLGRADATHRFFCPPIFGNEAIALRQNWAARRRADEQRVFALASDRSHSLDPVTIEAQFRATEIVGVAELLVRPARLPE